MGWTQRARMLVALALVLSAGTAGAATITIINNDGSGEGFNDPTVVTPVGGNPGTTLGEQRLNAFQHAADVWGSILTSAVEIRVAAQFNPLTCDASSAVLGSAGTISVARDFPGAEFAGTWYHVALANKLAGSDQVPAQDDLAAQFNSSIDNNNGCLNGTNWYYGLDGNHGSDIDLVAVILHELAHGLGFAEFVNLSTGQFFMNFPDIYSQFIFDNTVGLHWPSMTNVQRAASAVNTNNVVWDGPVATGAAGLILGPKPVLVVHTPGSIAGTYPVSTAGFGPALTESGLTGDVEIVDDGTGTSTDACEALVNGAQINGKIALVDRGTCNFTVKVKNAQNAGAIGVIMANNVAGGGFPPLGGSDPTITIPTVGVTQADGNAIEAELGNGVNVTMKLVPDQLAGTDANGRVLLFAPNPVQGGSSISHWDPAATPSLLMEPSITQGLGDDVDLTRYHFQDIGWFVGTDVAVGPQATRLLHNTPNPFNPSTTIHFDLDRETEARLEVYDVSGRLVRQLLYARLPGGPHTVTWNGRDQAGRPVATGVYLYRLRAGGYEGAERMVLVR